MIENLKSFAININQNFNFTGTTLVTWNPLGTILPWAVSDTGVSRRTDFNIEGFKNIEVYGFSLVGMVYPNRVAGNNQAIVQDWGVLLTIDGTPNLVNGFFGTNAFLATQGGKSIFLSKDLNKYNLTDPFVSVKKITISALNANGIQYESATSVDLVFQLDIIVYYKFEGE